MTTHETERDLLGGLSPTAWDKMADGHFYSTSTWLSHCASYPGASCGAAVAGSAAVPIVRFDGPPPGNYHWADLLAKRELPVVPIDGLLVGSRLAYQSHLLGDRSPTALSGLVAEVRALATEQPAVAMYLSTSDVLALHAAGVRATPVLLEPDAWLDVPEGGWDAWLQSLPSKRRVSVRREVRLFEEAGLKITHVALEECWDRLPPVANSMAIKYGYSARTPDFIKEFARYRESSGAVAQVALCTKGDNDDLLGFCMYYKHGDTIFLRWASFDYDLLTGNMEYFNLTYYTHIRLADRAGTRRLHAGKGAVDAKVFRGAHLRPLWMLDLSENSPHEQAEGDIRRHNARLLADLEADKRMSRAITDRAEWSVFC
ncbi:GNAT family N-acetyltransferase [Lentzea sp. PSKA42]|uniref:GNAT family N-acetyltransferase n=1 Tax=Lentzea indica TaxID=2604800 RepID=A0ABX1FJ82_9PSEU|nr:peptidogalycan biosysnthesis protein [Lentzea indica]NKE58804.1 GNAT family N-acetyltransferase [Lentzea indica]